MRPTELMAVTLCVPILLAACNTRESNLDTVAAPTAPTSITTPVPRPPTSVVTFEMAPGGTMGGGSGRGTLNFDVPVRPGGMDVVLTSSDPAVTISPSRISVPGGSLSASFSYATRAVTQDQVVNIVATSDDFSSTVQLGVWAVLPTFFSYASDRGDTIGRGGSGRFVPADSVFASNCDTNVVLASVRRGFESWSFGFSGPPGVPLRPGVYEGATSSRATALLTVNSNLNLSCTQSGRFTVHEVETRTTGEVVKFWATFETRCTNATAAIRGDIRISNPSTGPSFPQCRP
jgi:hypothetical protein